MQSTGNSESMERELKPIRELAEKYPKLISLMNRVDRFSLYQAHDAQARMKAVGVDGVSKDMYEEHFFEKIDDLVKRMKELKYIPKPVRRVYIPKANGKLRPLGIPAYEDRLVEWAMAQILTEIYETRFLESSYGFRPGRGAHDAVKAINHYIMGYETHVNFVLEADIKGFFDHVDHKWLLKFLEHDIGDKRFLRYIVRILKSGVMEGTELQATDEGCPQGSPLSPVLANVYLHYVLDLWVENYLKKQCNGQVYYVRYADDFVILFQVEKEARQSLEMLRERLGKFGLELAEDKTRILPIGRFHGTDERFDFLGFTFLNGKTRKGKYQLAIITSAKKLKAKKQALKEWIWKRMQESVIPMLKELSLKLAGHYNYYGVQGNILRLRDFWWYASRCAVRMLRRRSQVGKISYKKFGELWCKYVAAPRITKEIWSFYPTLKVQS